MVITHNMMAMNAQRQFNIVGNSKKKSTEKLSSGYRINRAADDAAGLAISEKMRRQIRGLTQASDNIQDGISLVQVADGALNETHEILQRINELSIKAANGTNTLSDREAIQDEIKELIVEVDRIANSTTFNEGIYPLNHSNVVDIDEGESDTSSNVKIDIDVYGLSDGTYKGYNVSNGVITLTDSCEYNIFKSVSAGTDKAGFSLNISNDSTISSNLYWNQISVGDGVSATINPWGGIVTGLGIGIVLGDNSTITFNTGKFSLHKYGGKFLCGNNTTINVNGASLYNGFSNSDCPIFAEGSKSCTINLYNGGSIDIVNIG